MGVKIFDGATDDLGGGTLKRNEAQEQALEDAKYEKWEKEAIANKQIMPEAPEMELWKDLQSKQTTNAAS